MFCEWAVCFSNSCSVLPFVFLNCFINDTVSVENVWRAACLYVDWFLSSAFFFVESNVVNEMVYRKQQFRGSTLASCVGGSRLILGSEYGCRYWPVVLSSNTQGAPKYAFISILVLRTFALVFIFFPPLHSHASIHVLHSGRKISFYTHIEWRWNRGLLYF
jgi:hypothetical protein